MMSRSFSLVAIAAAILCLSVVTLGQELADNVTTVTPAPSTPAPNVTTTTTTTTTVSPTNATTTEPPTTTQKPTTTSTTIAPPSSTVQPPTPPGQPQVEHINVTDPKSKMTCLLADIGTQFAITYQTKENQTITGYLNVNHTRVDTSGSFSKCGSDKELSFRINFGGKDEHLDLHFVKVNGTKYLDSLVLSFTADNKEFPGFPIPNNETTIVKFENLTLFEVPEANSYGCSSQVANGTVQNLNETQAQVTFTQIKLDVFRNLPESDNSYPNIQDCDHPPTPSGSSGSNKAGIAIGITLIVIVLIGAGAYVFYRRRNHRQAYQSV